MLRLSLLFILCFAVMNMTARAVGSSQPPNSALAGFVAGCEEQPQPCWYGVVPGVTSATDAARLWRDYGYTESSDGLGTLVYWQTGDLCSRLWVGRNDDIITRIGMPLCSEVQLGSLALMFDNAFHIVTQSGVTLRSGQVALGMGAGNKQCIDFNPFGKVAQIWLSAATEVQNFRNDLPFWRGYLSFTRYQQLYDLSCVPLRLYGAK